MLTGVSTDKDHDWLPGDNGNGKFHNLVDSANNRYGAVLDLTNIPYLKYLGDDSGNNSSDVDRGKLRKVVTNIACDFSSFSNILSICNGALQQISLLGNVPIGRTIEGNPAVDVSVFLIIRSNGVNANFS
jgi:hypothetical protein